MSSIGWDIGGVNVKVARVAGDGVVQALTESFSIEHDAERLSVVLERLGRDIGADGSGHAVTMTAELSQRFRTKAEGVGFVLDALARAFPGASMQVLDTAGRFRTPADARAHPLEVSASNWTATAMVVAAEHPDSILIDMGSTTTDIIPIESGRVRALGRTDPDRLAAGELVYTGAIRTPVEALVREVPWRGGMALVSADDFAHTGDVHLWLGTRLRTTHYEPDPLRPSRDRAGERLARVVCADRTMIDDDGITAIATHIAHAQVAAVAAAVAQVRSRHPRVMQAAVLGLGAPIAERAARATGLGILPLDSRWSDEASRAAPAVAVARLLEGLRG